MSYFPSDIPYMTDNELEEHGINAKMERGMEQGVNEVIVNELSIQFKNLGLIDECINDVRNALVDISRVYKEEQKNIDEAYQQGFEDGKAVNDKGCEGCKYTNKELTCPCSECSNNFKNQWTAKDDKFKFGDEIIDLNGIKGCVISKDNEGSNTMYALFDGCRVPQYIIQSKYRKTGKHYDIDKILEEIKGDNDK